HRPRHQTLRGRGAEPHRFRSALPLRRLVPADRPARPRGAAQGPGVREGIAMRTEKVSFYSEGVKIAGDIYLPDRDDGKPWPGIVQGPGFLGLKDAKHYA